MTKLLLSFYVISLRNWSHKKVSRIFQSERLQHVSYLASGANPSLSEHVLQDKETWQPRIGNLAQKGLMHLMKMIGH